ncbi:MAG TPA: biotin/lipoyl-containing protein, partial [Isosphaeraceae bacterium]|nr:biotin/lipoyl-containing protein [Isosphaeraceae bacterium]
MAIVSIKVPGVGESITEGVLARWLKPDGAAVKAGEPLFELETDKASSVVPAEAGGVLKIKAAEGATVAIGSEVGAIDTAATSAATTKAAAPAKAEAPKPAPTKAPEPSPASNGGGPGLSPAVRRLVAEEGVDPRQVAATGP